MTNRLAQSQSLYLRKHAENPINWWPWCDEAIYQARTENKPIFLSIGYSSCHWCTVMEGEAFSNPAVAEYMNANFLPIKVDREERPDIDSIYMQALQMMSGQGGWPLNVFVAPDDLVPFYAGTYFPVEPHYGRPGFLQVLQAIRRYYDTEKADLAERKAAVLDSLRQSAVLQIDVDAQNQQMGSGDQSTATLTSLLWQGLETSTNVISARSNVGNSFPMIPYAELALRGIRFNTEFRYQPREVCAQRGLNLALGGIYDHVGGGFHRYTVDASWTVPHFEKMLYDNGQIVEYLANLWSAGVQEPAFARAIAGTVQWLEREMTAPEGYFYAAQDADSFTTSTEVEPEEGAFYVWQQSELQQLLSSAELAQLKEQFTVTAKGNFEGKNVLQRRHSGELSDALLTILEKLFAGRYGTDKSNLATFGPARNNQEAKTSNWPGRIPPVTDTKMIVAWNSLMISGLAKAYRVFKERSYLELAVRSANFILENQWVAGRFRRINYGSSPFVPAQSEDYAFFIKALLDLHQACQTTTPLDSSLRTPHSSWLEKALGLQEEFDEFFWSVELGGYYNTSEDTGHNLIVRERSYGDNATPAANGVAIANLVRLAILTENLQYLHLAEQALQAFGSIMSRFPQACPSLFTALDWYCHCTLVRTNGEPLDWLNSQYLPTGVLTQTPDLPESTVGLVCRGLTCLSPALTHDQLWQQVQQVGRG